EFLTHKAAQHSDLRWRQVLLVCLGIDVEHVQRAFTRSPEIDDPKSTAFSGAGLRPPDLAETAGTAHDRALFRPQHQRDLEMPIFFIIEMPLESGREHRCL